MSDFRQITFRIIDVNKNNQEISLKVRTIIWCYDYVVDQNNQVVKGNPNKKSIYHYEMTFIRSIENNKENKCPNCGAPLDNNNSVVCSYCHSTIVNDDCYDWILSKKEMISQE